MFDVQSRLPQLDHHQPRPLVRLYCLNGGHHLRILPDGTVGGGRLEHDVYDTLRLKAVRPGVVVIRGEATGRYLAMDQDGRLYGSGRPSWYVGLKRSGEPKTGPATQRHQKAVYFLPRPVSQP
ncbi:hypothetical protein CRUP_007810 [Coryphaenoides rupestris]|nr:hypothetical protein CRUP_007810 [Coryphaenoides rupestris]